MKPWKVILTIVLLLISIIRLANSCNKHKQAELKKDFSERLAKIESARALIFTYGSSADDMIPADKEAARLFNRTIDSAVDHYRTIYFSDEKRYKQYLKVLYEYKKLSYEYQNLVKLQSDMKLDKQKKQERYKEIQQSMRSISSNLSSYRMAAAWDIYD